MKNILTTRLPKSINVKNQDIEIYTDFKKWIEFEIELENELVSKDKVRLLTNLVKEKSKINETNIEEVVDKLLLFYNCGEEIKEESTSNKQMYSFDKDQYLVYTDFIRFYDIDLSEVDMHWWKFKKLFVELPLGSSTKEAMKFRCVQITSKMSQEQRIYYSKMKRLYSLEKDISVLKKQSRFGSALFSGMNIKHD